MIEIDRFADKIKVLAWLNGQGYRVSKSKIYRDSEKGLLLCEPDGSVLMKSVERYVKISELKRPAEDSVEASAKLDQKRYEEIRQLKLRNSRLEHELDVLRGKYIEKSDADSRMADIAAVMDALPRHIMIINLPNYMSAVGADPVHAQKFFDLFDRDYTAAVNQVCDNGGIMAIGDGDI